MGSKARRTAELRKYEVATNASCHLGERCMLPPRCSICGREKTSDNALPKIVKTKSHPEGKRYVACRACDREAKQRSQRRMKGEDIKLRRMTIPQLIAWYKEEFGPDRCWVSHYAEGQRTTTVGGKPKTTLRAIVEHFLGVCLPSDAVLDHHDYESGGCGNSACQNPLHVSITDAAGNALSGESPSAKNKRKEYCIRDHPFTECNTETNAKGHRQCLTCRDRRGRPQDSRHDRQTALFDLSVFERPACVP